MEPLYSGHFSATDNNVSSTHVYGGSTVNACTQHARACREHEGAASHQSEKLTLSSSRAIGAVLCKMFIYCIQFSTTSPPPMLRVKVRLAMCMVCMPFISLDNINFLSRRWARVNKNRDVTTIKL